MRTEPIRYITTARSEASCWLQVRLDGRSLVPEEVAANGNPCTIILAAHDRLERLQERVRRRMYSTPRLERDNVLAVIR